jgi:tetratricopeptide (TPR) repeat protein
VLRSAVALDPDFAAAWGNLGICFGNIGEPDSGLAADRQALSRPERLDEWRKLHFAANAAMLSGDIASALALSERVVQLYPEVAAGHVNRGVYLELSGRLIEALQSQRTAEKVSPFGPDQIVLGNQCGLLLELGRPEEARQLIPRLRGSYGLGAPMWIDAVAGRWPAAESLATALRTNPNADDFRRDQAAWVLAAAQGSRGEVGAADRTLRQAQSEAEGAP